MKNSNTLSKTTGSSINQTQYPVILKYLMILVISILLTGFKTTQAQTIVYITMTGAGTMDGTSWANAADGTQIQSQINAASGSTQLWIAGGTYYPNAYPPGCTNCSTNRDWAFQIKSGVAIYGGFAGTETLLSQQDPVANTTLFSGDIGVSGVSTDNCYHIMVIINTDNTPIVDGITFSSAWASANSYVTISSVPFIYRKSGGAIFIQTAAPTINNCIFQYNWVGQSGGAIYDGGAGSVVTNCTFTHNTAFLAGGLYIVTLNVAVSNCTFTSNSANSCGGLCLFTVLGSCTVTNCTFTGNAANGSFGNGEGGAVYTAANTPSQATATYTNCVFNNNTATQNGGAFYESGGTTTFTNCVFHDNSAPLGGATNGATGVYNIIGCTLYNNTTTTSSGGAMAIQSTFFKTAILNVTNSTIYNNSAHVAGGALNITSNANFPATANFTNCVIHDNSATSGGGAFYSIAGVITLNNCALYNNSSPSNGGAAVIQSISGRAATFNATNSVFNNNSSSINGGVINTISFNSTYTAITNITNCTLFNNSATSSGGGIFNNTNGIINVKNTIIYGNTGGGTQGIDNSGTANVTYSDIQGGFTGTGNISSDPLFVNSASPAGADNIYGTADDGLFITCPSSPAKDAGTNTGAPTTDYVGTSRPQCAITDMGAYEVVPTLTTSVSIVASINNICPGTNITFTATPVNGGTATYQWLLNGANVGISSATYSNNTFVNGDIVSCTMTSSLTCTCPATSNSITVNVTCANTWLGTTTDWFTNSNWSTNAFPAGCSDNIYIPVTANNPIISSTANCGNIIMGAGAGLTNNSTLNICGDVTVSNNIIAGSGTLNFMKSGTQNINGTFTLDGIMNVSSGSSVIINNVVIFNDGASLMHGTGTPGAGGSVTGNITCNRTGTSSSTVYNYWSTPVPSATCPGSNVYYYNPANGTHTFTDDNPGPDPGWTAYSGTMTTGQGYASTGRGNASFTGVPNNGNYTIAVTTSAQPMNSLTPPSKYNLVGNPYPSAIDANLFISGNSGVIGGSIYYWDDDLSGGYTYSYHDYAVWNGLGSVGGGGHIPDGFIGSCQGIFVEALTNSNVNFTNSMRSASNSQFFKTQELVSKVWITYSQANNLFNEILLGFASFGTESRNIMYDAYKRRGNGTFVLSAVKQQDEFAIVCFPPLTPDRIIPLNVVTPSTDTYTFQAPQIENMNGSPIMLLDSATGIIHDLSDGTPYNLPIDSGSYINRFFIIFQNLATSIKQNQSISRLNTFVSQSKIHVWFSDANEKIKTVKLTDMLGREYILLNNANYLDESFWGNISFLADGIYGISVLTDKKHYSDKLVILK